MIETFRKLRDLLDAREQRNALLLFAMMLFMGLIEMAGVASVMPLMAVLLSPELVHSNQHLAAAYAYLGFADTHSFLEFLVAAVFVMLVGRITFTALTQYAMARFSQMRSFSLSTRLLENYLTRPYSWFLNQHSTDLGKSVLSEVDQVVSGSLVPALDFVSQAVVTVFLVGFVIVLQPAVAVTSAILLGGFYLVAYFSLRQHLARLGRERFRANKQRFQLAQEVLSGIKEVKIGGLEGAYLNRYGAAAYRFGSRRAAHMVLREMPRHVLEAVAFGGVLIGILVVLTRGESSFHETLPMLAVVAFAGLRLLPALHKLYQSLVMLRFGSAALDALHADVVAAPAGTTGMKEMRPLPLFRRIDLINVTFCYPNTDRPVLTDLSLTIPARTTVGFVGSTGAGKTTVVDIILGLLEPDRGRVEVDGTPITAENVCRWQRSIGYVPQHNFLIDETVAGNIAFGVPARDIDLEAVERAARLAELHAFVIRDLPKGYDTLVGERGVRLSGGQRQRIGIARALYHDPDVLVMDEATSALDSLTEKALMEAIRNLAHRKTILLVAHRLSTVRACDQIFLLERGRLGKAGTYDQLLEGDSGFRKMVTAL